MPKLRGYDSKNTWFRRKCVGGSNVGLILNILAANAWAELKSDIVMCPFAILAVFRFTSGFPVTRHLQNPDHFVIQLLSFALEKEFAL